MIVQSHLEGFFGRSLPYETHLPFGVYINKMETKKQNLKEYLNKEIEVAEEKNKEYFDKEMIMKVGYHCKHWEVPKWLLAAVREGTLKEIRDLYSK